MIMIMSHDRVGLLQIEKFGLKNLAKLRTRMQRSQPDLIRSGSDRGRGGEAVHVGVCDIERIIYL